MSLGIMGASVYGNWYIWNNDFTHQWKTTNVLYIFYVFIIPSNIISLVFATEHLWQGAWDRSPLWLNQWVCVCCWRWDLTLHSRLWIHRQQPYHVDNTWHGAVDRLLQAMHWCRQVCNCSTCSWFFLVSFATSGSLLVCRSYWMPVSTRRHCRGRYNIRNKSL